MSLRPMRVADAAPVAALVRRVFASQSAAINPPASALSLTEADVLAHLHRSEGAVGCDDAGSWRDAGGGRPGCGSALIEHAGGAVAVIGGGIIGHGVAENVCARDELARNGPDEDELTAPGLRGSGLAGNEPMRNPGPYGRSHRERLVGSVMWSARAGGLYVERLAVDPEHRRRGIARALLAVAEQAARARRLPVLHLGTRLALPGNRRLFAACGFVEVSRHAHAGFAEPTWVRMEKVLA